MKKMKLIAVILCVIMVCGTVLAGCSKDDEKNPSASGSEKGGNASGDFAVCVGPEPDTIDPALNSTVDGATLVIHGFEGLMTLDKNGTPVEGQAESYEISDDKLTYTFHLREGLKWSDGTPLTANDFVYSWKRAVNPETAADYSYMFECVEGYTEAVGTYDEEGNEVVAPNPDALAVKAVDENTLEVKLVAATPYFLEICAFPVFSPVQQATIEANGEAWATDAATYIGNGPYKMTEWVHDSYMIYEKNQNYWNIDALGPDSIKFVLMEDDNAQLSAYETGELLLIDTVPNDEISALSEQTDFYKEGQLGTYYVSFNTQDEVFSNPLVRKAFILAIDREFICEEIGQAGQVPAGAFVATGLSDADVTKEFREVGGDYYDPYDYEGNLELAKEALAEAGYPNGEGFPVVEYLYNEGTGHQQVGEALQDMWSKLGVQVNLVSQEWGTFVNTRKSGDYQIARNGWLSDYNDPISFLDMWITGGGNNDAQWSNAEYDKLISEVKSSSNQEERMEKMHQAEDLIFADWMLAPIYYYVDIYMLKDNVKGFYSSPLGYKYFMYATVE